jgi:hypothetical protein
MANPAMSACSSAGAKRVNKFWVVCELSFGVASSLLCQPVGERLTRSRNQRTERSCSPVIDLAETDIRQSSAINLDW